MFFPIIVLVVVASAIKSVILSSDYDLKRKDVNELLSKEIDYELMKKGVNEMTSLEIALAIVLLDEDLAKKQKALADINLHHINNAKLKDGSHEINNTDSSSI
ncbi:unnamed protein product [Schistosoma turkestanicum]|nr:unnamed protein product [Schistosoma turkestanicum]